MVALWIGFVAFVLLVLVLDLAVINRRAHTVSTGQALRWTGAFLSLGLIFAGVVYFLYENDVGGVGTSFVERLEAQDHVGQSAPAATGAHERPGGVRVSAAQEARANPGKTALTQYVAGWLTEYSLSVDNIFVIALIFAHFRVPGQYQHRVLFWGILGALVLRGIMIGAGTALVSRFEWVLVVFGVFLVLTAGKIFLVKEKGDDFDEEHSWVVRTARRLFPISPRFEGQRFFTRVDGALMATPLFLVLVVVEATDVIFAVDSIPAILGITTDPFLVFSSNVFAIMGLRSLYFALAGLREKFEHLKFSLGFILLFVGAKMLYEYFADAHVASTISLNVIAASLAVGAGTSLLASSRKGKGRPPGGEPPITPMGESDAI